MIVKPQGVKLKSVVCTFLLVFGLFSWIEGYSKDAPKYVVSKIPPELKENVNAFMWEDKMTLKIHSQGRASCRFSQAVTIFNSNASDFAEVSVSYEKLSKVTEIRGAIYDAAGNLIKKIKNNEIRDFGAYDGTLFSDHRIKTMDLSYNVYPYTVEFEYELDSRYIFEFQDFFLLGEEKVSCQYAECTLIYPKELKPRFSLHKIDVEPELQQIDDKTEMISWKFRNIKPLKIEPLGPTWDEFFPCIKVSPSLFEYDGYAGSMESWTSFGNWILSVNNGRNTLPEGTKQKIKELTSDISDPREKVKAVYKYMQAKTRYVSIQLGIGGLQPFEASLVDINGYGDCKALSNYMVSLLETIDIKAHYVVIMAGHRIPKFDSGFPSSQFNHAVACVPVGNDTIWLECTSQTNPFGYMGSFTGNRKALAITDNGAKIVNTPSYGPETNLLRRTATVILDDRGNASAKVETKYTGEKYETNGLHFISESDGDGLKKWVQKNTDIPAFDLEGFQVTFKDDIIPEAKVNLQLALRQLASVSGKRLFLTPNLMNRSTFLPPRIDKRESPVLLRRGYTELDSIHYQVPEHIYPEHLPEPVKLSSRFGEYEASFVLDQGTLTYRRKLVIRNGEYPPESYTELADFLKSVNRADHMKIVFLNRT